MGILAVKSVCINDDDYTSFDGILMHFNHASHMDYDINMNRSSSLLTSSIQHILLSTMTYDDCSISLGCNITLHS
jgi:hypothetical protein